MYLEDGVPVASIRSKGIDPSMVKSIAEEVAVAMWPAFARHVSDAVGQARGLSHSPSTPLTEEADEETVRNLARLMAARKPSTSANFETLGKQATMAGDAQQTKATLDALKEIPGD